jgi:hypothetical protein
LHNLGSYNITRIGDNIQSNNYLNESFYKYFKSVKLTVNKTTVSQDKYNYSVIVENYKNCTLTNISFLSTIPYNTTLEYNSSTYNNSQDIVTEGYYVYEWIFSVGGLDKWNLIFTLNGSDNYHISNSYYGLK